MKGVGKLFGFGQPKMSKEQKAAQRMQLQAARTSQEDLAKARSEEAASGRRLRGLGRRALAWGGSETGLATTLAG